MAIDGGLTNKSLRVWIMDSGASRHMTPNKSLFITKRNINTIITVASGDILKARIIDEVKIDLGDQKMFMKDVLLMPNLDANLLSISILNKRSYQILFSKIEMKIRSNNILIAIGIMKRRMYHLRSANVALSAAEKHQKFETFSEATPNFEKSGGAKIINPANSKKSENILTLINQQKNDHRSKEDAFRLWHERFGHIGPVRIKLLLGQVVGMEVIELPKNSQLTCETCNYSKLIRKINRNSSPRASRKLGRVHTDVWGPFRTLSIKRNRYFLSLIDDLARKSWIFCLRARSEIHQKISSWHAEIKLKTDEKPARFRADNALEYRKFEDSIRFRDIKVEFTTLYTPEENEVAERFNKTIIQMTRAMLIWTELPQKFWREAVCTTNYLRNLMPAGQNKYKSPNELWTERKLNVSHIKKFECLICSGRGMNFFFHESTTLLYE